MKFEEDDKPDDYFLLTKQVQFAEKMKWKRTNDNNGKTQLIFLLLIDRLSINNDYSIITDITITRFQRTLNYNEQIFKSNLSFQCINTY